MFKVPLYFQLRSRVYTRMPSFRIGIVRDQWHNFDFAKCAPLQDINRHTCVSFACLQNHTSVLQMRWVLTHFQSADFGKQIF